jgi:hypothetical protein
LSFASLLLVVVLTMRLPTQQRLLAGLIALLVWLGTAGAPGMATMHGRAEASLADGGALLWHALWQLLAGKIG